MDYQKIGFKCGIEIHQQLDTKKLFCNCTSEIIEKEPDYTIERKLRASAGETEEIDIAATQEAKKQKKTNYQGYKDNTCLIELDEAPPQPINQEALQTVLQVSKILQAETIDQIQAMRKIIVDGSNTSGFQRTALIAINGKINTSLGEIKIPTISIEEDSARIITQDKENTTYRLDRLGIPLIEIGTSADIKTPEHCKETAEKLGMILRSTGKVKRGLGTIRQDINISIKEGDRIEIKGAQDLQSIPKIAENEAKRQLALIEIRNILKTKETQDKQGLSGHSRTSSVCEITKLEAKKIKHLFTNTQSQILQKATQEIIGIRLKGFSGILGKELMPNHRFGTEISQRLKIILGLGIIHSDELPKFGITQQEVDILKKELNCTEQDAFIMSIIPEDKIKPLIEVVQQRINEAYKGVPREVRAATPEATSSYLRPLPGAARMYPETDVPKITITKKILDNIKIPELIEDKITKYQEQGLSKDLAILIAKSSKTQTFQEFTKKYKELKPGYIAELLMSAEKQTGKEITQDKFELVLDNLNKGKIAKNSVLEILTQDKPEIQKYYLITDKELEQKIRQIITQNKGLELRQLIGKAMQELKGKAESEKIIELLKKNL